MKIVCYVHKLNDGGAERVMSVLANGLFHRGHDVTLVTDISADNQYPLDPGIRREILGDFSNASGSRNIRNAIKRGLRLRKICKETRADIIISFIWRVNARAILATRFLKTKNVFSVRNDPQKAYGSKKRKALANLLYSWAAGGVFQTEEAQAWFAPGIQKKSRIILNPIADAFYQVTPAAMQDKRIVSCGRLHEQKRLDVLIAAFDKICDEFPDYRLEIYGVGALQEDLQKQINRLGRAERICLMGRCNDVPNTIKNASLFVLSSDYEGLPNALMEAMALGLPVVSTDCGGGGARALIDHGTDGLIVPCGDADALANAIRQNLADPNAAKKFGERAAEKAKSFSTENVIIQWESYITQLLDKK